MAKKTQMYTQCTMERVIVETPENTIIIRHTAWIPSIFGRVGKRISIKNSQEEWVPWEVTFAGSKMAGPEAEENETAYKRQRLASDQIRHRNKDGSSTTKLPTRR